ncbi:uncharacterized protein LOC127750940 [Frankliniella occidentalis]|uniref:Uncharacterized protein LOC127750940 n=1 Tax=Frankliniella occidentalis TaxID=133901 RepID=A0A9C6X5U5_FRAOC|nr:uncharacterized protein LOC127750940 [Frankliniella occidentalis]
MLCNCKHCQDGSKSSEDDDCQGLTGLTAGSVDADKLIEDYDSEPRKGCPDFKLAVVRNKGRQKTKAKVPSKWNFTSLVDRPPTCCICDGNVDSDHTCSQCQSTGHASHPCSSPDGNGGRLCNFCEASLDKLLSSNDPPSTQVVKPCWGCYEPLLLRLAKKGQFAGKKSFYSCKTPQRTPRYTGLPLSALDDLKRGHSLTDEHLNAACIMLKAAFSDLGGLTAPQNVVRFENHISVAPRIAEAHEDYIQMLNTGTGHWVLLIVSKGQPYLMDSLWTGKMTLHTKSQIKDIMSLNDNFSVIIPEIQQQDNSTDCGLYVIANAVEFAKTRQVQKVYFIREELRSHWLKPTTNCFHRLCRASYITYQRQNCLLKDPQPGHTCCKHCKVQNKGGHVCECVVCLDPTSDNANLIPVLCKVCVKPVHEFCSKYVIEEDSRYCFFCHIKKNTNLEKEVVEEVLRGKGPISKDHIISASAFLKEQFSDLGGLAEPKDVVRKKEYLLFCYDNALDDQDYVQFLSTGTSDWVLLVVQKGKPYLLCSDVQSKLTSEVETQVAVIMNCFQSEFTIFLPVIKNWRDHDRL